MEGINDCIQVLYNNGYDNLCIYLFYFYASHFTLKSNSTALLKSQKHHFESISTMFCRVGVRTAKLERKACKELYLNALHSNWYYFLTYPDLFCLKVVSVAMVILNLFYFLTQHPFPNSELIEFRYLFRSFANSTVLFTTISLLSFWKSFLRPYNLLIPRVGTAEWNLSSLTTLKSFLLAWNFIWRC